MIFSKFSDTKASGYWPKAAIISVFQQVYDSVELLGNENDRHYYKLQIKGLRFMAILAHANDMPEKITQFGFMVLFSGTGVTQSGLEALNRNLHISVAELDDQENVILFCYFEVHDSFDPGRFALVLEGWHRDIIMTLKMITSAASFRGTMSEHTMAMMRMHGSNHFSEMSGLDMKSDSNPTPDFCVQHSEKAGVGLDANSVKEEPGQEPKPSLSAEPPTSDFASAQGRATISAPRDTKIVLERFLGARDASRAICHECGGRGYIGFPRRRCQLCDGSGLLKPTRK